MGRLVARVEAVPLVVPLVDPFVIASARLDRVDNVAVRATLDDGTEGWGEVPTLHPVTAETFVDALAGVTTGAAGVEGRAAGDGDGLADALLAALPDRAATRAGIEQACLDAEARAEGVPLWRRFGSTPAPVTTDMTIPICEPKRASELAEQWQGRGFAVLKLKVGAPDLAADVARIAAVHASFPRRCWSSTPTRGGRWRRRWRRCGRRVGSVRASSPSSSPCPATISTRWRG